MILAEIADKMPSPTFLVATAIVSGAGAAAAFIFLRGTSRFIVVSIIACVTGYFALVFQVDADLVEAARNELGSRYITISRYWIFGSVMVAAILALILGGASSMIDRRRNQQAEQAGADQPATAPESKTE